MVTPQPHPCFTKPDKIEQDLKRLEKAGTIKPVQFSEWATTIVPVMKQVGR